MARGCVLCAVLLLAVSVAAQEKITLTVAEVRTTPGYGTARIILDEENNRIEIQLKGDNDEPNRCAYTPATTPTGRFLLDGLNKANLSSVYANNATTGSLKQRIYHRLVVMGEAAAVCQRPLVGTLTGVVP